MKEQYSHKDLLPSLFGFVSETSRLLWLVLLRLFVGIMWLYKGYTKVRDGWLTSPDYLALLVLNKAKNYANITSGDFDQEVLQLIY